MMLEKMTVMGRHGGVMGGGMTPTICELLVEGLNRPETAPPGGASEVSWVYFYLRVTPALAPARSWVIDGISPMTPMTPMTPKPILEGNHD